MAAGSDVRDILEVAGSGEKEFMTKDALMYSDKKKKPVKKPESSFKKPEGMHRELWGLLWTDNRDAPPIMPTDTNQGYKQMKAKIGSSRVRPWKWMPFTNPARKDGAIFHHWRRVADEGKDYPFARFNKVMAPHTAAMDMSAEVQGERRYENGNTTTTQQPRQQPEVPVYSDLEYQQHLHDDNWTRQETDHLFDLCKRFSLRFVVMHDRWDREKYSNRSVEDLKERYYNICNTLTKVRAPQGTEPKIRGFDAEHERKRKAQLVKLFNRTPEQVEEEEHLIAELKKIELRKKEREKKTQDLQKLITAADSNIDSRKADKKKATKKIHHQLKVKETAGQATPESTGIKFPDFKQAGVFVRSQKMKLPASVGQKKTKAIEQVLEELGIEYNPMPTEEIVQNFNDLRQDIVLLYELKLALATCDYELETLRHQYEVLNPGKTPDVPLPETPDPLVDITAALSGDVEPHKKLSESIDVVGGTANTPTRKRKAALDSTTLHLFKKMKNKT